VGDAVDAARTIADKVDAYIDTTLSLGANRAHRIAVLAGGRPNNDDSRSQLTQRHHQLSEPLVNVLEQQSIEHAALLADLVDGVLGKAIAQIDAGAPIELVTNTARAVVKRALDLPEPQP